MLYLVCFNLKSEKRIWHFTRSFLTQQQRLFLTKKKKKLLVLHFSYGSNERDQTCSSVLVRAKLTVSSVSANLTLANRLLLLPDLIYSFPTKLKKEPTDERGREQQTSSIVPLMFH